MITLILLSNSNLALDCRPFMDPPDKIVPSWMRLKSTHTQFPWSNRPGVSGKYLTHIVVIMPILDCTEHVKMLAAL